MESVSTLLDNYLVIDIETSIGKVPTGTKLFGADCAHPDATPLLVGTLKESTTKFYRREEIYHLPLEGKLIVGHNFAFDWSHLRSYLDGYDFFLWDTMLAEYLMMSQYTRDLHGASTSLSLDSLVNAKSSPNSQYISEMFKHGYGIDYIHPTLAIEYLTDDLEFTELLFRNQLESLRTTCGDTFCTTARYMINQMTASLTTAEMHREGLLVSRKKLEDMRHRYQEEIDKTKEELNAAMRDTKRYNDIALDWLGENWMNSPSKVSTLLYGGDFTYDVYVPTGTYYKTGARKGEPKHKREQRSSAIMGMIGGSSTDRTTGAAELKKLSKRFPKFDWFFKPLLKLRNLNKSISTYIDGIEAHIYPDGKIHGNYSHSRTATKRLASSRPNLQNLSNVSDTLSDGTIIFPKDVFVTDKNYQYAEIDYSSLEVRVLALASNDANLIQYINNGVDMHRMFASRLYNKSEDDVTDNERKLAKAFSFQLQYGASAKGIAKQWDQPLDLVQRFIDEYYEEFPAVKLYHEKLLENLDRFAGHRGDVADNTPVRYSVLPSVWAFNGQRDLASTHRHIGGFGMVETVWDNKYRGGKQTNFKPTTAKNYPIQGAAADIMNSTLVALRQDLPDHIIPVNTVHDSVLFKIPTTDYEIGLATAKAIMENVPSRIKQEFNLVTPVEFPCVAEVGSAWSKHYMESA